MGRSPVRRIRYRHYLPCSDIRSVFLLQQMVLLDYLLQQHRLLFHCHRFLYKNYSHFHNNRNNIFHLFLRSSVPMHFHLTMQRMRFPHRLHWYPDLYPSYLRSRLHLPSRSYLRKTMHGRLLLTSLHNRLW